MYRCNHCGDLFTEPSSVKTSYEAQFGIRDGRYTPMRLSICPNCQSEEIEDYPYKLEDMENLIELINHMNIVSVDELIKEWEEHFVG